MHSGQPIEISLSYTSVVFSYLIVILNLEVRSQEDALFPQNSGIDLHNQNISYISFARKEIKEMSFHTVLCESWVKKMPAFPLGDVL